MAAHVAPLDRRCSGAAPAHERLAPECWQQRDEFRVGEDVVAARSQVALEAFGVPEGRAGPHLGEAVAWHRAPDVTKLIAGPDDGGRW